MHTPKDQSAPVKKTWAKPRLVTHGTVEELTGTVIKHFGFSDGFAVPVDGTVTDIGYGS